MCQYCASADVGSLYLSVALRTATLTAVSCIAASVRWALVHRVSRLGQVRLVGVCLLSLVSVLPSFDLVMLSEIRPGGLVVGRAVGKKSKDML